MGEGEREKRGYVLRARKKIGCPRPLDQPDWGGGDVAQKIFGEVLQDWKKRRKELFPLPGLQKRRREGRARRMEKRKKGDKRENSSFTRVEGRGGSVLIIRYRGGKKEKKEGALSTTRREKKKREVVEESLASEGEKMNSGGQSVPIVRAQKRHLLRCEMKGKSPAAKR